MQNSPADTQVRETHVGDIREGLHPMGGNPMLEVGNSKMRKEQQTQAVMNWQQPPFQTPLCHLVQEKVEDSGTKVQCWA